MIINIIHDDRRIERYQPLIQGLAEQGLTEVDYVLWPAKILQSSVVCSINASHKMIVQWAKDNHLPQVCIAEDDLMFTAPDAWQYFLDNKPAEFDLYLACTYVVPVKLKKVTGFHLYVVSEKFYDRFLSVPYNYHIDTAMDDLEGDYHFCYPFPALQRPGVSANNGGAFANYNSTLKPKDIYGGGLRDVSGR